MFIDANGWLVATASPAQARAPFEARIIHPVAPMIAACLGTFRILQHVLPGEFGTAPPAAINNTWNFLPNTESPALGPISLDHHVIGLGSIGSTAVHLLAQSANLSGKAVLLDKEVLESRNLARYAFMTAGDGRKKVDWCQEAMAREGLTVEVVRVPLWQFAEAIPENQKLPWALISVDTVEARRQAADILPERTISATVNALQASITLGHLPTGPCSFCPHVPPFKQAKIQDRIAKWSGLTVDEVVGLIGVVQNGKMTSRPLEPAKVSRIEQNLGVEAGALSAWVGGNLLEIYGQQGHRLYAAATARGMKTEAEVALPVSAASALAGALMANETLKGNIDRGYNHVEFVLSEGRLVRGIRLKNQDGHCLCQHPRRIDWYNELYPQQVAPAA